MENMKISANDVSDTFGLGSLSLLLLFWLVVTSTNSVELADTVSTNFELPSFASTTISVAIIFALHAYGKALILIGDFFSKPKLLSVLKILVELDSVARESDQRLGEKKIQKMDHFYRRGGWTFCSWFAFSEPPRGITNS